MSLLETSNILVFVRFPTKEQAEKTGITLPFFEQVGDSRQDWKVNPIRRLIKIEEM